MTYEECSLAELAEYLELTERRVQQLSKEDVIVKVSHGKYDLHKSVKGYLVYLREKAYGGVAGTDQHSEKTRLLAAQANIAELNDAEMRGELVNADEIKRSIFTAARQIRNSIQTIPDRLSTTLAGIDDHYEIHNVIESELNQVLTDMDSDFEKLNDD